MIVFSAKEESALLQGVEGEDPLSLNGERNQTTPQFRERSWVEMTAMMTAKMKTTLERD